MAQLNYPSAAADRHSFSTGRAIERMLATDQAPRSTALTRPTAIFRVVSADAGFMFTRVLSGPDVSSIERLPERFGPYATERAAHELAQRAAARFSAQSPSFVVGVVGIDPEPEPSTNAARPPKEQGEDARKAAAATRARAKYARQVATPEGRERHRQRWRERYAKLSSTPEGRERLRERWRKDEPSTKATVVCDEPQNGVMPICQWCAKPTGYYHGRPLKFCPRRDGEKYSLCNVRHTNRRSSQAVSSNPELRLEANLRQRKWEKNNPEKRKEKQYKGYLTLRNNPRRWAYKLAKQKEYKAQRRANDKLRRERGRATRKNQQSSRQLDVRPTGSVLLTASPRAIGRELLASIYAAVSDKLPRDLRMEIICETAVLVMEGVEFKDAVVQANKNVRKNAAQLRYTKPIDDCFWLADETAFSEASL